MYKKISFSLILTFFFLVSCVSFQNGGNYDDLSIEETLIDSSMMNINQLIDQGDTLKALQLILSVDEGKPEYRDVSKLYPLALSEMEKAYKQAEENKEYGDALRYYKSFIVLDEVHLIEGRNMVDLQYDYMISLFDRGSDSAAVSYLYNNLTFDQLSEESLKALEERLVAAEIIGPLEKLFDYYVLQSINAHPDTIRLLGSKPSFQNMIEGTVTVWVNRGIKIENGVGIPDRGIGSGFFIDNNGHILTNYHVISSEVDPEYEGFSRLFIKLSDDSEERIPAKVIGWDKELDVALLKTEIDPEYIFSLSRDYDPVPGDKIFAIGSPGGLKNTLTTGTVSTLNRQLQSIGDTLQIDVPINPGNSGGPLLNPAGEVIGVVFAGIEQFEGVNFAIPVSDVKEILPELYSGGAVSHPWLGCALFERSGRLEVLYVLPGSPAHQIGLERGDVIDSINGESFTRITEIQRYLLKSDIGTLVDIKWIDERGTHDSIASLDKRPDNPMELALARDAFDNLFVPFFGMDVERIRGRGNKNVLYNLTEVYPGTTADEAGLSIGDSLILRKWESDDDNRILIIQIIMKTRKAGFIESAVQIGTYLDKGFFI